MHASAKPQEAASRRGIMTLLGVAIPATLAARPPFAFGIDITDDRPVGIAGILFLL